MEWCLILVQHCSRSPAGAEKNKGILLIVPLSAAAFELSDDYPCFLEYRGFCILCSYFLIIKQVRIGAEAIITVLSQFQGRKNVKSSGSPWNIS